MPESRARICPFDNDPEIKIPWYSEGRWSHFFVMCKYDGLTYRNVRRKNAFGFIPVYEEINLFNSRDILQYVNMQLDFYGKTINEVFKEDNYLTDEIKMYFMKLFSWDQYGTHIGGNYGHDFLASSADAYKMFGLQNRQEEIAERSTVSGKKPATSCPWAH